MPSSRWRFHALHTPMKSKNELCHAAAKYQLTCLNRGIQGFFPLRFWHSYLYEKNRKLFITSSVTVLFVLLRMWIGLNWLYVEPYLHNPPYTKLQLSLSYWAICCCKSVHVLLITLALCVVFHTKWMSCHSEWIKSEVQLSNRRVSILQCSCTATLIDISITRLCN